MQTLAQQPIDIVLSWVDGSDPAWLAQRAETAQREGIRSTGLNHESRYRDIGLLKFALRSIDAYAPWVRKIFLVTPGQSPTWLNTSHPKLTLIDQDDIVPTEYQPVFKSTTLEWFLHKIPGLSEHFIYFNDDMLLTQPVNPQDFFVGKKVKVPAIYRPVIPDDFSPMIMPALILANKHFGQRVAQKISPRKFFSPANGKPYLKNLLYRSLPYIPGYYAYHVALPMRKSTIEAIWQAEHDALDETCRRPFRDPRDVISWLVMYWEIETDNFEPQHFDFGLYTSAAWAEQLPQVLRRPRTKSICINDSEDVVMTPQLRQRITDILTAKFPRTSPFERPAS
ncbi:MAG: Stealth CR1 domain-containing protein [Rothia sp. (in: high G+C Gram-positive bacteria)]|nr:Stealth CR1 domain-containing protein [Rothia sp. (in: high G+C Gram-positive bacteria)]